MYSHYKNIMKKFHINFSIPNRNIEIFNQEGENVIIWVFGLELSKEVFQALRYNQMQIKGSRKKSSFVSGPATKEGGGGGGKGRAAKGKKKF